MGDPRVLHGRRPALDSQARPQAPRVGHHALRARPHGRAPTSTPTACSTATSSRPTCAAARASRARARLGRGSSARHTRAPDRVRAQVLVDEYGIVKLSDLGSRGACRRARARRSSGGTPYYMAPSSSWRTASIRSRPICGPWAARLELAHGSPPFTSQSLNELIHQIRAPRRRSARSSSRRASSRRARLLAKDPLDRPAWISCSFTRSGARSRPRRPRRAAAAAALRGDPGLVAPAENARRPPAPPPGAGAPTPAPPPARRRRAPRPTPATGRGACGRRRRPRRPRARRRGRAPRAGRGGHPLALARRPAQPAADAPARGRRRGYAAPTSSCATPTRSTFASGARRRRARAGRAAGGRGRGGRRQPRERARLDEAESPDGLSISRAARARRGARAAPSSARGRGSIRPRSRPRRRPS